MAAALASSDWLKRSWFAVIWNFVFWNVQNITVQCTAPGNCRFSYIIFHFIRWLYVHNVLFYAEKYRTIACKTCKKLFLSSFYLFINHSLLLKREHEYEGKKSIYHRYCLFIMELVLSLEISAPEWLSTYIVPAKLLMLHSLGHNFAEQVWMRLNQWQNQKFTQEEDQRTK